MRLLQAMAGAPQGGAELFFERLAIGLSAVAGLEQRLVVRRDSARAARLAAAGLDPLQLRFGAPLLDLPTRLRLRAEVKRFQPQILLSWMNRASDFAPTGPYCFAARLGGYYAPKHYRRCDRLIANTEDIRAWLIGQGFAAERVHYLPNFVTETPGRSLDRAAFDTPADAPLLLCLGRLHRNKGFDVAVAALAQIPGAYLWIAGEGPERAALTAQAQALGVADRLRLLGWRSDAVDVLATADVFFCSSRHEPLGNVVLEAWAQGTPVLAARAQGPTQLIADGVDGLLVDVDDADQAAAAARRLIADADARHSLGSAGRETLRRRFSPAAVIALYQEFFAMAAAQ